MLSQSGEQMLSLNAGTYTCKAARYGILIINYYSQKVWNDGPEKSILKDRQLPVAPLNTAIKVVHVFFFHYI